MDGCWAPWGLADGCRGLWVLTAELRNQLPAQTPRAGGQGRHTRGDGGTSTQRVGGLGVHPGRAEERRGGTGRPRCHGCHASQPRWRGRMPRAPRTGGGGQRTGKGRAGACQRNGRWKVQGWQRGESAEDVAEEEENPRSKAQPSSCWQRKAAVGKLSTKLHCPSATASDRESRAQPGQGQGTATCAGRRRALPLPRAPRGDASRGAPLQEVTQSPVLAQAGDPQPLGEGG